MGFESRLMAGIEFEKRIVEWLKNRPGILAVAENGTEHTHPDFVEKIRQNNTQTAKLIRYAPDGVYLLDGQVFHYDAKRAKAIEKTAYETYMAYRTMGCKVVLFVEHANNQYWQYIEKVKLIDGNKTVAAFPENLRFPVDDDGWICPRLSGRPNCNGKMSGTPYKEIDFDSMKILAPA